jgi:tRNA (cytidine/uridine-2'-O-)-methyltransferase
VGDTTPTVPEPLLHVALYQPEIPQNTGNIGRLCVGLGARLHLIRPLGFDISEKAVRRAGLDYWRHLDLVVHDDAAAFFDWSAGRRCWLFAARASTPYTSVRYEEGDVLLFGPETVGLPKALTAARGAVGIPMPGPVRSLNLSNAVAIATWEALRQLRPGLR